MQFHLLTEARGPLQGLAAGRSVLCFGDLRIVLPVHDSWRNGIMASPGPILWCLLGSASLGTWPDSWDVLLASAGSGAQWWLVLPCSVKGKSSQETSLHWFCGFEINLLCCTLFRVAEWFILVLVWSWAKEGSDWRPALLHSALGSHHEQEKKLSVCWDPQSCSWAQWQPGRRLLKALVVFLLPVTEHWTTNRGQSEVAGSWAGITLGLCAEPLDVLQPNQTPGN